MTAALTLETLVRSSVTSPVAGINTLLANAKTQVLIMRTSVVPTSCPIGWIQQVDHDNLRRGLQYRLLVPDAARTAPRIAGQLFSFGLAGADIRTVPAVPMDALVIDGEVAVLPAGPAGMIPALATLRLPSIITTTTELFKRVWADAMPLAPFDLPHSNQLSEKHPPAVVPAVFRKYR
ncbi:hypothetical protein [Fodinicola feengrottensis]|uniref:hypothetical protein n=1 Tax=Fodinicola feengrottensis TaxID=435914 RepID=UPI0024434C53|nr:hypothetical protein [Fodinicola feengrottensis]